MLCEEGMTIVETRSALSIPQSTKQVASIKTQSIIGKIEKHYINCGMINHNVETCKKKKDSTMVATIEATQPSQKTQKTSSYACDICGLNEHQMIDSPKFVEMPKMFHGTSITIAKVQPFVETQTIIADVNVVDVNVTTRSKVTKKQVFKDKKPRKEKTFSDWEKEERLKQLMVETIQHIQKKQTQIEGPSTSMEGWNTIWPGMPNTTPMDAHKFQEVVNLQRKLIIVEEIFLHIGKQMLETNYTLNLGQLFKIAPKLKRYLWQKLKLEKIQNVNKATTDKQVCSLVPEVGTIVKAINNI